ncbi:MAG: hypothetical protein ACYCXG_03725 [Acidiferrobacter sp.]
MPRHIRRPAASRRDEGLRRQELIVEAARIMAEDGARDFQSAKRKAAHRLNLPEDKNWPANAEIEAALRQHWALFHQGDLPSTLRALRDTAYQAMVLLDAFAPRLVGEVLSGALSRFPEIQIHIAADTVEDVDLFLQARDIPHDLEERRLRYRRDRVEQIPVMRFVAGETSLALYIFSPLSIRELPLSPVDGRPLRRASRREVAALLAATPTP